MSDEPASQLPGVDRRQSERVPARLGVRFRAPADAARAMKAYSLNFSLGGLCLKTRRAYEVGQPMQLSITVRDQELTLQGVVAWVRAGAVGVRFVELTDEIRERLAGFLAQLKE